MEVSENGETSRMVHEGQDRSLRVNKSIMGVWVCGVLINGLVHHVTM